MVDRPDIKYDFLCSRGPVTKIAINIEVTQRKITQALAENAKPPAEHEIGNGKAGQGRGNKTGSNHNPLSREESAEHLTVHIARDWPALLDDMKQANTRACALPPLMPVEGHP